MTPIDGLVQRCDDGGYLVAFDRELAKPQDQVWAALTEPPLLARWLGDVEVDLRLGGVFIIRFRELAVIMSGVITALQPGHLIEYSWLENYGMPQSVVRWELFPCPQGSRLRLTHRLPPACALTDIFGFAGGWHAFLDAVARALEGEFVPYQNERPLEAAYRQRFTDQAGSLSGAESACARAT